MTEQEIKDRLAELYAKQEAATSWGAAVGARHEEIKSLEGQLAALRRPSTASAGLFESREFRENAFRDMEVQICGETRTVQFSTRDHGGDHPTSPAVAIDWAAAVDLANWILSRSAAQGQSDSGGVEQGSDGRFRPVSLRTKIARAVLAVLEKPNGVETLDWQIADSVTPFWPPAQPVPVVDKGAAVAWRWRHPAWAPGSWNYQTARPIEPDPQLIVEPLYATPQPASNAGGEPTKAQIDAALHGWFSVKPSASESDAVLERSMKAALIAAGIGGIAYVPPQRIGAPGNCQLQRLWSAIVDNTQGDGFWIGEILLTTLEREVGFNPSAVPSTEGK